MKEITRIKPAVPAKAGAAGFLVSYFAAEEGFFILRTTRAEIAAPSRAAALPPAAYSSR